MARVKVLQFICPTGMYGAERWILALNRNLDPEVVESEVVITLEDSRQVKVIDQFRKSNQIVNVLEMQSRFSFAVVRDLCRLIKDRDAKIIHTHGYKSDILGLIAARKTGIKAIATPHGFGEPSDLKLKLYVLLGKVCLRFFDIVSPLSRQLEDELDKAKVPRNKIVFVRNAVDLDEVEEHRIGSRDEKGGGSYKIGYIGQIIPRKKIDHMLDVFNRLWLKNNNIELEIIGDGESRQEMEEYARTLPSSDSIVFLGFREDRLKYLNGFDLFVMTSSNEGIPRCMMEAVAMGIPVAAYDISGVNQLIIHEKTGLLADYGDKTALAGCWERLLFDKALARLCADNGRKYIAEEYSGRRMAREYSEIYESMLSSFSPG